MHTGTFHLEFAWLSLLTGDSKYEEASRRSMRALWKSRTPLGLFGSHISAETGEWTMYDCSIGGGVDSYFEYLIKVGVFCSIFTTDRSTRPFLMKQSLDIGFRRSTDR